MSKRLIFLLFGVCLAGLAIVFLINRQANNVQAEVTINMFREINSSALSAQSGQEADIANLVDTIFAQNGIDQLNPNLVSSLKDRIVRAELNGQSIEESQVVQALNWLADQYSAPSYAKTSLLQTRVLRLMSNQLIPNLFIDKDSQGNIGLDKPLYSQPSSNMPPTQAVTLLSLLIHQKIINENFQKEPAQWDSDFYAIQQSNEVNQQQSENGTAYLSAKKSAPETEAMRQLAYGTNFSQADQEELAQGILDQLGIPR